MPTTVMSEAAFQRRVMDTAQRLGWLIVHIRPARTASGWVTAYEGDEGLPDLILARRGRVLLIELKADKGRATPAQLRWLAAAGDNGRLWRPRDWDTALHELQTL